MFNKKKTFAKGYFIITAVVIVLDLLSKFFIDHTMQMGQSISVIDKFFYITYIHNAGAAWGMLAGQQALFIGVSAVAAVVMILYFRDTEDDQVLSRTGIALVYGGIIGNLVDRLLFGYVRDFLDFFIFGYDYPVFNIADVGVVLGIFCIIIDIVIGELRNDDESDED